MKIEGVAYLPEPDEYPATWEITDQPVPLRVEFNPLRLPIGMATLTKHDDGTITCVAQIAPGEEAYLGSFPKFAVSIGLREEPDRPRMEGARVMGVSVCHEDKNRDVPPYQVIDGE